MPVRETVARRVRRRLAPVFAVGALWGLTACSPAQEAAWRRWFAQEPQAATEWALNECGALCTDDWDHDGVVEPEPSSDEPSSDSSAGDEPSDTSNSSTDSSESESDESAGADYSGSSVWDSLAECESGGDWGISTGNGYYGGLQFALGTWQAYGGSGYPHEHSREEQIRVAENLRADQGFSPWPSCSAQLGL